VAVDRDRRRLAAVATARTATMTPRDSAMPTCGTGTLISSTCEPCSASMTSLIPVKPRMTASPVA
jgi:hypothetical protein